MQNGELNVSLHSNQLRGETYNGGFMANAMVDKPRLIWKEKVTGAVKETPLAFGLVGNHGVLAPLYEMIDSLSTGKYDVVFQADVINSVLQQGVWPVKLDDRTSVSITLGGVVLEQQ